MPLHISSTRAHRRETKIVLYSLWYHHTETSEWSKITKIILVTLFGVPSRCACIINKEKFSFQSGATLYCRLVKVIWFIHDMFRLSKRVVFRWFLILR